MYAFVCIPLASLKALLKTIAYSKSTLTDT